MYYNSNLVVPKAFNYLIAKVLPTGIVYNNYPDCLFEHATSTISADNVLKRRKLLLHRYRVIEYKKHLLYCMSSIEEMVIIKPNLTIDSGGFIKYEISTNCQVVAVACYDYNTMSDVLLLDKTYSSISCELAYALSISNIILTDSIKKYLQPIPRSHYYLAPTKVVDKLLNQIN